MNICSTDAPRESPRKSLSSTDLADLEAEYLASYAEDEAERPELRRTLDSAKFTGGLLGSQQQYRLMRSGSSSERVGMGRREFLSAREAAHTSSARLSGSTLLGLVAQEEASRRHRTGKSPLLFSDDVLTLLHDIDERDRCIARACFEKSQVGNP